MVIANFDTVFVLVLNENHILNAILGVTANHAS